MRWPKMPPLTSEQSRLAADNYGLVVFIVRELLKCPIVSLMGDDAMSEGFLALVKAARAFDPNKVSSKTGMKVKFNTYAGRTIKNEVCKAADRWRKKTFVPDMDLLVRSLQGITGRGGEYCEDKGKKTDTY